MNINLLKRQSLVSAFFLLSLTSISQNISGIINLSQNVIEIDCCKNSVKVPSATGFNINDKVLLIQMMGAVTDTTNSPAAGSIIDYAYAGNYEFGIISDVINNVIYLRDSIQRLYDVDGKVQIVRVPVFANASISDTLTCAPWNGLHGGVLVLEVTGTLSLNGPIDVSNKGFLGGEQLILSGQCSSIPPNYVMGSLYVRPKGEGIARLPQSFRGGIGPMGNGGGSSGGQVAQATITDAWYLGGGGGGNGGQGGRGGKSSTFCPANQQ